MIKLIIATKNLGKVREIKDLVSGMAIEVLSLKDLGVLSDVIEDGTTFRANAAKKAVTIALATGALTMGEDSGLEVDALDGRPGVYSARYSGENATDEKNNDKLLEELKDVPWDKRTARYRSAMALASPEGLIDIAEGTCEGIIANARHGTNGFGYDPLFWVQAHQDTFGVLPLEVKQSMSHRARAFKDFLIILQRYLVQTS